MITAQVIENCIEELRALTKVNLAVYDLDGMEVASTFDGDVISGELIRGFADSPAGSQTIGKDHLLKVMDEGELTYILAARGNSDQAHMIGKIAVSQIQQLVMADRKSVV